MIKPKTFRNVCGLIVANDYCIGCGICAGICPAHVLEMKFNDYGEYQPVEFKEGCLPRCDLCLSACPFFNQGENEDSLASAAFLAEPGIKHSDEVGYYLNTFAGYNSITEQRLNSASGGLATLFLSSLLENKIIDRVICVIPDNNPEKLFRFIVIENPQGVFASAKSCYYPVEMSEVIREILKTDLRFAVIGLPCFLKGIRLAMRKNARLRNRISILVGIVCGQTKSKFFAEYLCKLMGGEPRQMYYARFRVKDLSRPANHFGFQFKCASGKVMSGTVFWLDGMMQAWTRGYFKPNACNYCDDIFAEVADVVFMDAWLERYIKDPKGTSFVILRRSSLLEFLKMESREGKIFLEDISIEDMLQSQRGVINIKRVSISERLSLAILLGQKALPHKRVKLSPLSASSFIQRGLELMLVNLSKRAFYLQRHRPGLRYFDMFVTPILFLQRVYRRLQIIADHFQEIFKK